MTTYIIGGGCFWCLDALYRRITGVTDVTTGYAGGTTTNAPSVYVVGSGLSAHAAVVRVSFDQSIFHPALILDVFFAFHDGTALNGQGGDDGTQYRSTLL